MSLRTGGVAVAVRARNGTYSTFGETHNIHTYIHMKSTLLYTPYINLNTSNHMK